ncbi:DNA cytosine methyltransferase [Metarhizobium album]|uniref:DNA cytosine methyltransferase n=1 Tax=Metarhizobium album TaxID=2182425 RepID=UPI003B220480
MHRAGFTTIAACEFVDWRRALYSQNNPGVPVYDDVRTLSADRLVRDGHRLPDVIVGSPPCQDISSANTKGKGVEGERSGLYFEAIRIIGECRPRWFALENSSNLRTRGADAVLAALEALGYSCWSFVVRAGDIGANHERPRCWLVGCDVGQIADTRETKWWPLADRGSYRERQAGERRESSDRYAEYAEACLSDASDPYGFGRDEGRQGRWGRFDVSVSENISGDDEATYASQKRPEDGAVVRGLFPSSIAETGRPDGRCGEIRDLADADQAGQADGRMVAGLRQAEIADDGRGARRGDDGSSLGQMAVCPPDRVDAPIWKSDWSLDDLADHLQLDDGLSSWVAGTRIAVGGPKGTSAASLIVEAFGDAVVPQIPEAIGRAILRTERALAEVYGRIAA